MFCFTLQWTISILSLFRVSRFAFSQTRDYSMRHAILIMIIQFATCSCMSQLQQAVITPHQSEIPILPLRSLDGPQFASLRRHPELLCKSDSLLRLVLWYGPRDPWPSA